MYRKSVEGFYHQLEACIGYAEKLISTGSRPHGVIELVKMSILKSSLPSVMEDKERRWLVLVDILYKTTTTHISATTAASTFVCNHSSRDG